MINVNIRNIQNALKITILDKLCTICGLSRNQTYDPFDFHSILITLLSKRRTSKIFLLQTVWSRQKLNSHFHLSKMLANSFDRKLTFVFRMNLGPNFRWPTTQCDWLNKSQFQHFSNDCFKKLDRFNIKEVIFLHSRNSLAF